MIDEDAFQTFINETLVDKKLKASFKKYKVDIENNDENVMRSLDLMLSVVLSQDAELPPKTKLCALRFVKEAMNLKNANFAEIMTENTYPVLLNISEYHSEDQRDERGRSYFGSDAELEAIGTTYLRLCLECVFVWSIIYSGSETYIAGYNYLVEKGVKFPKDLNYFKKEEYEIKKEEVKEDDEIIMIDNKANIKEKIDYLEKKKEELLHSIKESKGKNLEEANVKIVLLLNEFLTKESEVLKGKLQKNEMKEYELKLKEIIVFSMKLINIYNSYQMKDISYGEFKKKIFEKDEPEIQRNDTSFKSEKPKQEIHLNESNKNPENVRTIIDSVFASMDGYKKNKSKYLEMIISNDEKIIEIVCNALAYVLSSQEKPIIKLLALKFLKDAMDTRNSLLASKIETHVLSNVLQIALYKQDDMDLNRGRFFFSSDPNDTLQQQGQTFFLLATECIMNWGEWYNSSNVPIASHSQMTFYKAFSELTNKRRILPDSMMFFMDYNDLDNFIKLVDKLKISIVEEINKNDYDDEIDLSKIVDNAKEKLDVIKIKDLKNKTPKNLFDNEKKKLDNFYSSHEFLQNFIADFQGKNEIDKTLVEKYKNMLADKLPKKTNQKNVFDEILEKCILSENEFKKHKICIEAVEKNEQEKIGKIIDFVKKLIIDTNAKPISRFLALKLVKECMDINNQAFLQIVSDNLLDLICLCAINSREELKSFLLGNSKNDEKIHCESFYKLAIECVLNWGYIYPNYLDRNHEHKFKLRSNEIKLNNNVDLPENFLFFDNPKFFDEVEEMKKKSTKEKSEKYIVAYEEIKRSLIKSFDIISNEFDYEPAVFKKYEDNFKQMESDWEDFRISSNYLDSSALYRFNQCREEILKFLKDLPEFTFNYPSYLQYRTTYLKIHAPQLLIPKPEKFSLSQPNFHEEMVVEDLTKDNVHISSILNTGEFYKENSDSIKTDSVITSIEEKDKKIARHSSFFKMNNPQIVVKPPPATTTISYKTEDNDKLFEINENPNENLSYLESNQQKVTEESFDDEEKRTENNMPIKQINNKSNFSEFYCRSFKEIIEKSKEDEAAKLTVKASYRRRATSQFGTSDFLKDFKPKILRKKDQINLSELLEGDIKEKSLLLQENNQLTEELKHLNEKNELLMKDYNGLLEKNHDLNDNHGSVKAEYDHLRKEYEFLMKENPKKLKQIQEELIGKYNRLFEEHSVLSQDHQRLFEDHENLKKIPIIPRISSTEDLDLLIDDQLRFCNKNAMLELNSLRTYHQELLDELDENPEKQSMNEVIPPTPKETINQDQVEEIKRFDDSQLMNLSSSIRSSKKLEKVVARKSVDLGKIPKSKIFEPFKLKEDQMVMSSNLQKTLKMPKFEGTPPKIFGPMRNNYFETQEKNHSKMYYLSDLPNTKKSGVFNSSNKREPRNKDDSNQKSLKLSEFLNIRKYKQPNKLEQAMEISEFKDKDEPVYGGMIQSMYGYVNNENFKGKNSNIYYMSERNFRGKIIEIDHKIFDHAKISGQSLTRLKLSCLKNKANVYESDLLQIGCITTLEKNDVAKDFLKVSLYITNKSSKKIFNVEISYIGDTGVSLWTRPEKINSEIKENGQIKQDLVIDFSELPYPLLTVDFSYKWNNQNQKFRFILPTSINKYLEWKEVHIDEFRKQWRGRKIQNIIRTEILNLNNKISKGVNDFKRYFTCLVDLKPHQEIELVKGSGHYSLGGGFYLSHTEEFYQIKIIVLPGNKIVFKMGLQTALNEEVLKVEEFILYTLAFLFSQE